MTKKMALQEASKLYGEKCFPEAITYYREALRGNPNNTNVLFRIGLCHQNMENYEAAEKIFNKILAISEHSKDCWLQLAQIYYHQERLEEALKAIKKYNIAYPKQAIGKRLKADILIQQKEYKEAISLLNEVMMYEPENTKLVLELAELNTLVSNYDDALICYDLLMEMSPANAKFFQSKIKELKLLQEQANPKKKKSN